MARKRKGEAHGGGHGWYVTFADLMALLMAFFVMIAAFSTMNQEKMQQALGSMRDAFGVQTKNEVNGGVIEINGVPVRSYPKNVSMTNPTESSRNPGLIMETQSGPLLVGRDNEFASAATSIRQALQDIPELTELSKHIIVERNSEGLAIQITDQDGRSMFPDGSSELYERVRVAFARIAPVLQRLPQRVSITGHTAASQSQPRRNYGPWELSADRANAVRRVLVEGGLSFDRIAAVTGRAATQPIYPDNPYLPANRRITITLLQEAPPVPVGVAP